MKATPLIRTISRIPGVCSIVVVWCAPSSHRAPKPQVFMGFGMRQDVHSHFILISFWIFTVAVKSRGRVHGWTVIIGSVLETVVASS